LNFFTNKKSYIIVKKILDKIIGILYIRINFDCCVVIIDKCSGE